MRFLGSYVAAQSPLHRTPVWVKYLVMFGATASSFAVKTPWVGLGVAIAAALVLLASGIEWRKAVRLPISFGCVMAGIFAYHAWATTSSRGFQYVCGVVAAIYLARVVTMTPREADLLDAIAVAARPLRLFGAKPESIALAAALMWRSIPFLMDHVAQARLAARARGLRWASPRLFIPVIVSAIGYALTTQDALRARGL